MRITDWRQKADIYKLLTWIFNFKDQKSAVDISIIKDFNEDTKFMWRKKAGLKPTMFWKHYFVDNV